MDYVASVGAVDLLPKNEIKRNVTSNTMVSMILMRNMRDYLRAFMAYYKQGARASSAIVDVMWLTEALIFLVAATISICTLH